MHPRPQTRGHSSSSPHHLGTNRVTSPPLLLPLPMVVVQINGVSLSSKRNKVAGLLASNKRLLPPHQEEMLPGSNKDKALAPANLKVPIATGPCYAAPAARRALASCASKRARSQG